MSAQVHQLDVQSPVAALTDTPAVERHPNGSDYIVTLPTDRGVRRIAMSLDQLADLIPLAAHCICADLPEGDAPPMHMLPVKGLTVGRFDSGALTLTLALGPGACLPFTIPREGVQVLASAIRRAVG